MGFKKNKRNKNKLEVFVRVLNVIEKNSLISITNLRLGSTMTKEPGRWLQFANTKKHNDMIESIFNKLFDVREKCLKLLGELNEKLKEWKNI
ncbi:MAG: hypothetical protein ACFFG0_54485 [Candidatus Thorarchaeota archaeon]